MESDLLKLQGIAIQCLVKIKGYDVLCRVILSMDVLRNGWGIRS